jgi:hypothetical protein
MNPEVESIKPEGEDEDGSKDINTATLYLLAEEPVQNQQQQDCCLIVEVHAPDGIDNQWVQQAAENAIKEERGLPRPRRSSHPTKQRRTSANTRRLKEWS